MLDTGTLFCRCDGKSYCILWRNLQKIPKTGGVLELGPAEGVMTDLLFPLYEDDYTVVDGAPHFIDSLKKRHQGIKCYAMLFEEFEPERKYENIILGHVLEHVQNPVDILMKCGSWLTESGCIIAAVPNAESLHRQAAVKMGLLKHTKELNETDKLNGHRRVYDLPKLKSDFVEAGLRIVETGGYWLKPLSNSQINNTWTSEMIDAFLSIGELYPNIAGEIYIVAGKNSPSVNSLVD